MNRGQRARSTKQKGERREAIVAATLKLFETKTFQQIGVADVARRAGIAKGTFFLYFSTKEELFFHISREEFRRWLDDMDATFGEKKNLSKSELLTILMDVLKRHYLLAKLIALQHSILEHNVDYGDVAEHKRMMIERIIRTGGILERCSPSIPPGRGFRLLMWMSAMVIGLFQLSEPAPVLKRVYSKEPGTDKFRIDFGKEYFEMLGTILDGLKKGP
jgi:AcrR family transcriptional regulator